MNGKQQYFGFGHALFLIACVGGTIALNPLDTQAQQTEGKRGMGFGHISNVQLTISPTLVSFDEKTKTARVELLNETPDTLESEIILTIKAPMLLSITRRTVDTVKKKPSKGGLLGNLLAEDTARKKDDQSIPASQSLVPWVSSMPAQVRLAPGAKEILTLTLDVPADARPGQYFCWLVALSSSVGISKQQGGILIMGPDGKPLSMPSFTKLTYTVSASQ